RLERTRRPGPFDQRAGGRGGSAYARFDSRTHGFPLAPVHIVAIGSLVNRGPAAGKLGLLDHHALGGCRPSGRVELLHDPFGDLAVGVVAYHALRYVLYRHLVSVDRLEALRAIAFCRSLNELTFDAVAVQVLGVRAA